MVMPLSSRETGVRRKTKLIYGVGINDATHSISLGSGKPIRTYATWVNMLVRCYSPSYLASKPTYRGCSVSPEWLHFSTFERWMLQQDHVGLVLDKDFLVPGNREYGPERCVFISKELNSLLNEHAATRGALPIGVDEPKPGRFMARCNRGIGVQRCLGTYDTPQLAHAAWQVARALVLDAAAKKVTDRRVTAALLARSDRLRADLAAGVETISLNSRV